MVAGDVGSDVFLGAALLRWRRSHMLIGNREGSAWPFYISHQRKVLLYDWNACRRGWEWRYGSEIRGVHKSGSCFALCASARMELRRRLQRASHCPFSFLHLYFYQYVFTKQKSGWRTSDEYNILICKTYFDLVECDKFIVFFINLWHAGSNWLQWNSDFWETSSAFTKTQIIGHVIYALGW